MKKITKDIIIDLLPLYIAGETSEKTTAIIKEYLESDNELAEVAKTMMETEALSKAPIPFRKETAMENYEEAKKWMTIRILGLATLGTILIIVLTVLIFFATSSAGN